MLSLAAVTTANDPHTVCSKRLMGKDNTITHVSHTHTPLYDTILVPPVDSIFYKNCTSLNRNTYFSGFNAFVL